MKEEKHCFPCQEPVAEQSPGCALHCMQQSCKAYKKKPPLNLGGKPVIWVLGGPGLDTTNVASQIGSKYGLEHIAIRDLFRKDVKKDIVRGACLEAAMKRGEYIPNSFVLELLRADIEQKNEKAKGFVISGYPREKSQGYLFENTIGPVSMFIFLEAKPETLGNLLRQRARLFCPDQNKEDTLRALVKRFFEDSAKVLEQYPHRLVKIDAEKERSAMMADIFKVLDPLLLQGLSAYNAGSPLM